MSGLEILTSFFVFIATPAVYGSFGARRQIQAAVEGLHHSHSITRSELHLRPVPQLAATPGP